MAEGAGPVDAAWKTLLAHHRRNSSRSPAPTPRRILVQGRLLSGLLLLLLVALAVAACGGSGSSPTPTPTPAPAVALPQDDAPHEGADIEWWYYNGHLETAQGERYGFHYVVFQAIVPGLNPTNVVHLAITDHQLQSYPTAQRLVEAAPLAQRVPGFVFAIDGFAMSGYDGRDRLTASAGDYAFDLALEPVSPPVLHGGTGFLDFGPGGRTYYYSRTRLAVSGSMMVLGRQTPVTGQAWFDHQWLDLQPQTLGWDWFALQLDHGSEVMLFHLRDAEGGPLADSGTLVTQGGGVEHLGSGDFEIASTGSWTSPVSAATYPMG